MLSAIHQIHTIVPKLQPMIRSYTQKGIQEAHINRSTPSLIKEAGTLGILGNTAVSRPLGAVIKKLPDVVIDTPPISWAFKPIISQFGTVNTNLEAALDQLKGTDVADLAKEGIALHEDPKVILDRHVVTIKHPNVKHMALKVSSFVPAPLLQSGIETPSYLKGLEMMRTICRLAQQLDKKIYIDAEGVAEQRLIDKTQHQLAREFNDTVYLTFQSMRSDTLQRLDDYLEFSLRFGQTPLIKQVKGAYHTQESPLFPNFYHHSFEDTHSSFKAAIEIVGQFPGKKHQFIGTMNPALMDYSQKILCPTEYTLANLKGMEVGPALGIHTLIYHPIALKPSELIQYGVRRLIELGSPENLTERRLFIVSEAVKQRLGFAPSTSVPYQPEPCESPLNTENQVHRIIEKSARKTSFDPLIEIQAILKEKSDAQSALSNAKVRDLLITLGNSTLGGTTAGIHVNQYAQKVEETIDLILDKNPAGQAIFDTPEMKEMRRRIQSDRESAMNHPGF